jgi:hypothetical protein
MKIPLYTEKGPGVFHVFRNTGEPPFAKMCSPKASGSRKWSITYRDPTKPDPLGGYPNLHKPNKREAMEELTRSLNTCSDYQLGLVPTKENV